jgi:hypothetical protein
MSHFVAKISGTNWLCIWRNDKWLPLTELTDAQIRDCQDVLVIESRHESRRKRDSSINEAKRL